MTDTPKILWVDDEAREKLQSLNHYWRKAGLQVDTATSFREAENLLAKTSYSSVLMDVIFPFDEDRATLPRYGGLDLIGNIRKGVYQQGENGTRSDIPVAVLSVLDQSQLADKLKNLNVDYFYKLNLADSETMKRLVEKLRQ